MINKFMNNTSAVWLVQDIVNWHLDRNMIEGSTNKDQFHKLIQECGELSDNLVKGKDRKDDYGDIMVVLIGMMERDGYTMQECLQAAYDDIKDRRGRMIDGVYVKEADL